MSKESSMSSNAASATIWCNEAPRFTRMAGGTGAVRGRVLGLPLRVKSRQNMSLLEYLHILRQRWWLIPLPALLIVALTLATTAPAVSPGYAVSMRFSAGLPPEAPARDAYSYDRHYNWLASEYITRGVVAGF